MIQYQPALRIQAMLNLGIPGHRVLAAAVIMQAINDRDRKFMSNNDGALGFWCDIAGFDAGHVRSRVLRRWMGKA